MPEGIGRPNQLRKLSAANRMAEEIAGKPSGNPRIDFLTKENRRKVVNTMDEGLRRRGERNKTQKLIAKSGGLDPAKHATDRLNWFKD